jgi:hypothetical protein
MAEKLSLGSHIKAFARNSPWLAIAIAVHVIAIAITAVVYVKKEVGEDKERGTEITVSQRREAPPAPPPQPETIERKAVPENKQAELVTFEQESFVPFVEQKDVDLHMDVGDPTGLEDATSGATGGTSIGVGIKGGHYSTGVPSTIATRRAGTGKLGRQGGPTQGTEEAVLEGLRWLARHQNEDGSWGGDSYFTHCVPERACLPKDAETNDHYDEGLTSLALLCYLGHGFGHDAKQELVDTALAKKHKIGNIVKGGLKWLADRQQKDGRFSEKGFMYNEALATMAMCEAYALTNARQWKDSARKGLGYLLESQKPNPGGVGLWGWRYGPRGPAEQAKAEAEARLAQAETELKAAQSELERLEAEKTAGTVAEDAYAQQKSELSDAIKKHGQDVYEARGAIEEASADLYDVDISVTTWVVMALKSAEIAGLEVPQEAIDGALAYTRHVSRDDGLVGYVSPGQAGIKIPGERDHYVYHTGTMSALSMLVRTFLEKDVEDPFLEAAAQHIVLDLPTISKDNLSIDYYYWYYATLALNQFDGPDSPRKSGKYWTPWNKALIEAIPSLQDKSKERDVCTRGGWLVDDRWSSHGYALYNTAINVLTLEVYYRFANAFGASDREREKNKAAVRKPAEEDAEGAEGSGQ